MEIKDHHKPELDMLNIGQKKKTVHRETMCIRIMITFKIIKIFFKYKILVHNRGRKNKKGWNQKRSKNEVKDGTLGGKPVPKPL